MYCRVIACDFDGTGASDGRLAPEVADVLHAARNAGVTTLLATGRVLDDLRAALVDFSAFDAVVAENGAIVWFPASGHTIQLGPTPPASFLDRLRSAGIPFHAGAVVIGTWDNHAAEVLRAIREAGADLQLVFNRAALMLLPSGVNKATGVQRALDELGCSARNMIAFGDAENDLPLFSLSEVAVVARGAASPIVAAADDRLTQPGPAGVAYYVQRLLAADAQAPTPARRSVVLGRTDDAAEVRLAGSHGHVLVSGDPRSGKSWLAGLIAERLVDAGYRLCMIDPEGDYGELARVPGVVVLGDHIPLPKPADLPRVLRAMRASVVLNLSALSLGAKRGYVCPALAAMAAARPRDGLPHWTLVDEAHYFFGEGNGCCAELLRHTGNVMLATYRPSLLAACVHDGISAHFVTRTEADAERYHVESLLGTRGPRGIVPADALAELRHGRMGVLTNEPDGPRWRVFTPGSRRSPHVHHRRKYVEGSLPDERAFRFLFANGVPRTAHNVQEFAQAVAEVPMESLRHHLTCGDFSRWFKNVCGDPELAAGLAKLETTTAAGAAPSRDELLLHLRDRYVV